MADQGLKDIEADQIKSNYDKAVIYFDEMNLKSELLRSVYVYGLECPSQVQQRAIMPMINGNDVILEAPSATGKTLSLCISALQIIDPNIKKCQAVIITSTVDMARQIHKTIIEIGQFAQIKCLLVERRHHVDDDTSKLHDGQQVLVSTPGRMLDLLQRRTIPIESTMLFILDEADEIFARGFSEHIPAIHQLLPGTAQVVFSSTTMPDEVLKTATRLMRDPLHIILKRTKIPLFGIKHFYIAVEGDDLRLDILSDLSATLGVAQAVIFCNTRKKVEWLAGELTARGITTSDMHADMPAFERADIIERFRSGSSRILLATNMLARGLDVQQSSLVVNYELPALVEEYVHRTSYGARSVRPSITINLINPAETFKIHDIDHHYSPRVQELTIPEAKRIMDFTRDTC